VDGRCSTHSEPVSAVFRAARPDFDRFYRRHVAAVYRYAYAVLGNHPDAEDVTQQTFLNAYRAMSEGTTPRKAENWLVTIAHNEVRRHFRRVQGKPLEVALDDALAEAPAEQTDPSLADVVRALQHLPPLQRSALVMREFEGRSYAEIAEVLDVTQSALETIIFRARRALAEHLDGALTCAEAEQALSRRLDGRLRRREARRLKAHLRECPLCVRYADVQKRQSSLLKGFSVMPIPASLFLFRGEQAAATAIGAGTAAGGSAAVAGGGFAGLSTAFAVKAAAVTATVGVAGGVGYTVTKPEPVVSAEPNVAKAADIRETRDSRRIAVISTRKDRGHRPVAVRSHQPISVRKAHKRKPHARPSLRAKTIARAKKALVKRGHTRIPAFAEARASRPATKKPKRVQAKSRARTQVGKRRERPQVAAAKPAKPQRAAEKSRPEAAPPPPAVERGPKSPRG
jgi:RNA polymerase sigma factor (sigma-70 family)